LRRIVGPTHHFVQDVFRWSAPRSPAFQCARRHGVHRSSGGQPSSRARSNRRERRAIPNRGGGTRRWPRWIAPRQGQLRSNDQSRSSCLRGSRRRRRCHHEVPRGLLRQDVRSTARRPRQVGHTQRGEEIIGAAENWVPQIPRYEPKARIPSTKAASVTRWLVPVDASATHSRRGDIRRLVGAVAIVKSPRSSWIGRNGEHPAGALSRGQAHRPG
jgi:hypothetical protein